MRKAVKYIILIAIAGLLGFQSVYFETSVCPKEKQSFDAVAFAKKLWEEQLRKMDSAVHLPDFMVVAA
jgi:hypothetical protein